MNENYFVNISDSVFLEKSLLSVVKSSIEISISNQKVQSLKTQKLALLANLKKDIDELNSLIKILDDKLPHKDLFTKANPVPKNVPTKSASKKASKKSASKKAPEPVKKKPLTKLDRLNSSLAAIEERLNSLS